jgi:DNA repair protein RadD
MDLREYQIEPHQKGVEFFAKEEPKPGIIVAPTAFGKSHLIAHTAKDIEGRTIVLQPTKELLEQNYKKIISLGARASIFSASMNRKNIGAITYATIGSVFKIGDSFKELGFRNMIIDEVHLYPRTMESMLGTFLLQSGITKVLGLTATPFKLQNNTDLDGERFSKLQMLTSRSKNGHFFKDIIHVTQIQELTSRGYWSKLEYEVDNFSDEALEWNTTKSDYTEQSLFLTYSKNDMEGKILDRLSGNDRNATIIFVPSINDAVRLARKLPSCAAVHSKLDTPTRDRIIKDFRNGYLRHVVNVNILAVGFDHPDVDQIVSARPTASLAWFYQALGRGTRLSPRKNDCRIIDFAGNV